MDIRPMAEDDLEQVNATEREVFPNPWSPEFFRAELGRERGLSLVAEEEGRLAGYLVVWAERGVHVSNIAVVPGRRRTGIGRRLMAEAEKFARKLGTDLISLEVRESNAGAHAFYRRLGVSPVGIRQGYYENGEDAVVMAKTLSETTR